MEREREIYSIQLLFRYHSLLGVPIPHSILDSCKTDAAGDTNESSSAILHYVYSCLFAHKVSPKVCSCIMELTFNLLSGWDGFVKDREDETMTFREDKMDSMETDGRGLEIETSSRSSGPDLVLPMVPKLLSYLNTVIESEGKRVKAGSEPRNIHLEFTVISK